jgi:(2Fe-2S) ferredoxin
MPDFSRHIFMCINQRPKGDPRGSCADNGSVRLQEFMKKEVERLGLKGVVRANKAGCLDHCEYGPSIVVYPEGVWYWAGTEADITQILVDHIIAGKIVDRLLMPGHKPPPRDLIPLSVPTAKVKA